MSYKYRYTNRPPLYHHRRILDLLPRLKPWDSRSGLPEHPCLRKGCLRLPDITFALYKQLGYSLSFQASRALRFIGIPIRRPEPFTKRTWQLAGPCKTLWVLYKERMGTVYAVSFLFAKNQYPKQAGWHSFMVALIKASCMITKRSNIELQRSRSGAVPEGLEQRIRKALYRSRCISWPSIVFCLLTT